MFGFICKKASDLSSSLLENIKGIENEVVADL